MGDGRRVGGAHGVPEAGATDDDLRPIPRDRLGETGVDLSIIAFGGIVVIDTEPAFAKKIVAEAFDRGIDYFDVAPSYGNAQERLGPSLEPYRKDDYLVCKRLSGNFFR